MKLKFSWFHHPFQQHLQSCELDLNRLFLSVFEVICHRLVHVSTRLQEKLDKVGQSSSHIGYVKRGERLSLVRISSIKVSFTWSLGQQLNTILLFIILISVVFFSSFRLNLLKVG